MKTKRQIQGKNSRSTAPSQEQTPNVARGKTPDAASAESPSRPWLWRGVVVALAAEPAIDLGTAQLSVGEAARMQGALGLFNESADKKLSPAEYVKRCVMNDVDRYFAGPESRELNVNKLRKLLGKAWEVKRLGGVTLIISTWADRTVFRFENADRWTERELAAYVKSNIKSPIVS